MPARTAGLRATRERFGGRGKEPGLQPSVTVAAAGEEVPARGGDGIRLLRGILTAVLVLHLGHAGPRGKTAREVDAPAEHSGRERRAPA